MNTVGYLLNKEKGPEGEPGLFYDYILAGNGVFVRARSSLIRATVLISRAQVRGLSPLREGIELPQGRIPWMIYDLAVSVLAATPHRERYLAVTWEGKYHLRAPAQVSSPGGVEYEPLSNTVLDIHSHGTMSAFFSSTDNRDEQGLRIYMVMGRFDTLLPDVAIRVGVYGYFAPVRTAEVFDDA
jgi:PRTRC genetic system protein A